MRAPTPADVQPPLTRRIVSVVCWLIVTLSASSAFALGADTVRVIGGRYMPGETFVSIPINIVNSEILDGISVPLELRSITAGAFVTSVNLTFSDRLGDPMILPDVVRQFQFETNDPMLPCRYVAPVFTDGASHPVTSSPEGVWFFRSGDAVAEQLPPGSDIPGLGSMYLGVDLTNVPGKFEIDTMCMDPGGPLDRLAFSSPDAGIYEPVFVKGTIVINSKPVARDTTLTMYVNQVVNGQLHAYDVDGDPLAYSIISLPAFGDLDVLTDRTFQYASPPDAGVTSFEFEVSDGLVLDTGTVTIIIDYEPPDSLYVRKSGSDVTGDGTTGNPYRTVPFAISQSSHGDVVFVGPGTYNQPGEVPVVFPSTHKLTIRSEAGPFQTALVGTASASGSVVVMHAPDPGDTLTLIGFTVRDNIVDQPGCDFCGGGITVGNLTVGRIINCVIRNNTASGSGSNSAGGVLFNGAGGQLLNNWIVLNTGTGDADAVGAVTIGPTADVAVINNTIVLNRGPEPPGIAGVMIADGTSSIARFDNNIIAFNAPGAGARALADLSASEPTLNNLYFGNDGLDVGFPSTTTWVRSDPFLADTVSGDFHLTCPSPARNGGQIVSIPSVLTVDIDGQLRVPANPPPRVDIGADQFYDANKKAKFSPSVDTGCAPLTVTFSNQSTCIDESWSWTFGDGGTSSTKNPIHQFQNPGMYQVRLIAFGVIDADTTFDTIVVQGPVSPNFTSSDTTGCAPFAVTFTASPAAGVEYYTWDYGDGAIDTGFIVQHSYSTPSKRSVSVTAHNKCGSFTHTKTDFINIITTPTVQMTSTFDTIVGAPCNPFAVTFQYSSNYPILAWNWDFGDDKTSTDSMPVHVYQDGDTFSVRLIATGECGPVQVVRSGYIKLTPRPIATAFATPTFACVGSTQVTLSGTVTGSFTSAQWLFGDGGTASGVTAQHQYSQVGKYLPRLVVTSACGQDTIPVQDSIIIGSLPSAAFAISSDSGYESHSVQFTDQSSNLPSAWQYRFGDGQTSTSQNPVRVYGPGLYEPLLIASNLCGADTSDARRIVVGSYRPVIVDSLGTLGDTILYSIRVDTLVIGYDHPVYLGGRVSPLPIQGSVAFVFEPRNGTPPFDGVMKVIPSENLATGNYSLELRATDSLRQIQQGQPLSKTTTRSFAHVGETNIGVTPAAVTMDSTIITLLSTRTLTIRNTSTPGDPYTLIVQPAQISGPPFEILPNQGNGATLNPGQQLVWTIGFRPTRKDDFTGWVRVRSNDPGNPDFQVTLTGRGIGEQVPPRVTSSTPSQGGEVTIDQSFGLNFSEPIVIVPLDTIFSVQSKRANSSVTGSIQFFPLTLTFTPSAWLWPDDTLTLRLRALVTDTNGNRLDGNADGSESGPPLDDFVLTIYTGPGVYPGDANHDGSVNEGDILPLGRFWRLQGPPRVPRSTEFRMQPARGFPTRVAAHADCDGNGIVDSADICLIAEYFDRDTALAKATISQWVASAQTWSGTVVDAMIGALLECPSQGQSTAILRDALIAMKGNAPVPSDYSLGQNYPNPFNPATAIEFSLPQRVELTLDVFDILGRRVVRLASGEWEAGNHRIIWNGQNDDGQSAASGMYFYRLSTHGFSDTRKMLLLK